MLPLSHYRNLPLSLQPGFVEPLKAKYSAEVVAVTTEKYKMSPEMAEWLRRRDISLVGDRPLSLEEAAKYGWLRYVDALRSRRDYPKPDWKSNLKWAFRMWLTRRGFI